MEVLYPRCAGLDVHQASIAACVRVAGDGPVRAFAKTFATTPAGLAALRDWLRAQAVTHVALEGTGVYWMPPYEVLEAAGFDLTLCNARHVKQVPGRKTDQSDAAWLAQLLAAGLLKKSFVPPAEFRALRELTRARVHLVEDRAAAAVALHQVLERAGVKLASVVSDLQGATARAILAQLAAGATDAVALAALARGTLRAKRAALEAVLAVPLGGSARLLVGQALARLDLLDAQVAALDAELATRLAPHAALLDRLRTIGGLDDVALAAIVAELGPDVHRAFASGAKLAAWAGVAPGQHESAGVRKRVGARAGNAYLRRILVQVAIGLSRRKRPHDLTAFFRKKRALGFKKAAVATAHKLLVRLWAMLATGTDYAPPPAPPLSAAQRTRQRQRLVERLEQLGYAVTVAPVAT